MTTQDITVELENRNVVGKGLASLRKSGQVPVVIHDHGNESLHAQGEFVALVKAYSAAGKHHPVQIKLDGKSHLALIKNVDLDPAKNLMRHVVFQAVNKNETVTAEIPISFTEGVEIPAERISLLVLKQIDHVEVKALPNELPDELFADPSTLKDVGDSLSVADLQIPKGVTLLTPTDVQIAIVEMPRDQIAEANAATEAMNEGVEKPVVTEVTEAAEEEE